jgi:alpha-mannosidase
LLPHEGGWEEAGTVKRAAELNCKPIAVIESFHEGSLPQSDSYVQVDHDNIIINVIKKAEDNDDLILRCYETSKLHTDAVIRLLRWNRTIKAHFMPSEVKPLRIPKDTGKPVTETDMIEWE